MFKASLNKTVLTVSLSTLEVIVERTYFRVTAQVCYYRPSTKMRQLKGPSSKHCEIPTVCYVLTYLNGYVT